LVAGGRKTPGSGNSPPGFSKGGPEGSSQAGTITMVVNQGEGEPPAKMQVPVVAGATLAQWLKDQKPVITPEVARIIQGKGHQIDVWAEYLPILLDDGRTVLVPLEQVEIELRGKKDYQ
jgi:hypothetical protein